MTVYDGIGISRYMKVHDRHMSVYDKYSVLILVMDTDVPGTRTLISGTCVLILHNSVPGCCCDWYMLAHPALLFSRLHPAGPPECCTFVAPKRHARSSTNDFILSSGFSPFPLPTPPPPLSRGGGGFRGRGRVVRGRGFRGRGGGRRRRVGSGVGVVGVVLDAAVAAVAVAAVAAAAAAAATAAAAAAAVAAAAEKAL